MLAVLDFTERHRAVGVITPWYLVRFLCDNRESLGTLGTLPMSVLLPKLQHADVRVYTDASLGVALRAMMAAKTAVVASVVDRDTGRLVAALSKREQHALATLGTDIEFNEALDLNVVDAITNVQTMTRITSASKTLALATVHLTDTYATVVELMAASELDVVHVVDEVMRPMGIVTAFDMIRAVRPPLGGLL